MAITVMPPVLQERLGTDGAMELVEVLNQAFEEERRNLLVLVEDRYERRLSEEIGGLSQEMVEMGAKLRQEMTEMGAGLRQEMAQMEVGLRQEMAQMEAGLRQEMAEMEARLREEINKVRTEMAEMEARLQAEMAKRHSELIRWMFIFWLGQFISIAALIITLVQIIK